MIRNRLINMKSTRMTVQLKCPNPLFEMWIQELHMTAVKNESKTQHTLKIALKSIKKYPLVLNSGSDCAILQGFGKNLCQILDSKLNRHNNLIQIESKQPIRDIIGTCLKPTKRPLQQKSPSKTPPGDKKPKPRYVPGYRTGAYAILVTLFKNFENNIESMTKTDLQFQAHKYCDESMSKPKPGSFYSGWSNMNTLITKGFVVKERKKVMNYSLTDTGRILAQQLVQESDKLKATDDDNGVNLLKPFSVDVFCPVNNIRDNRTKQTTSTVQKCTVDVPIQSVTKIIDNDFEINSCQNSEDVSIKANTFFEFAPESFDVLLLVDKQEISGASKKDDATIMELNKYNMILYELRHLKVGDFAWVARHRITGKELVLPHIVERKRIDDLSGSIKDGRFHEQKFRLKQCGVPNVIYLVESYGNNQRTGLPLSSLMQAVTNTRVQDGFMTHSTPSLSGSIKFLAMMTKNIEDFYKNKRLTALCGNNKNTNITVNNIRLMEFDSFNSMASKSKVLAVKDLFIKQLLQLKGISVEKAVAIVSIYKTPKNLMDAYENCKKEPELLLANVKYGITRSNVGPGMSKIIYYYFTKEILS